MILGKAFYVSKKDNTKERIWQILKEEFGLIDAEQQGVLIWKDEFGNPRYRVRNSVENTPDEEERYLIVFHYWLNQEYMRREIMERDPMKPALDRVLEEVGDKIIVADSRYNREESLETVLSWIKR